MRGRELGVRPLATRAEVRNMRVLVKVRPVPGAVARVEEGAAVGNGFERSVQARGGRSRGELSSEPVCELREAAAFEPLPWIYEGVESIVPTPATSPPCSCSNRSAVHWSNSSWVMAPSPDISCPPGRSGRSGDEQEAREAARKGK